MQKIKYLILFIFQILNCNEHDALLTALAKKGGLTVNVIIKNHYDAKAVSVDVKTEIPHWIEKSKQTIDTLKTFFEKYKYKSIAVFSISCYIYTTYKLKSLENLIFKSDSCSNFKSEISLQNLLKIPTNELYTSLINDINQKYCKTKDQNNLINFIEDINKEINNINHYLNIINYLKKLYIARIFNIKEEKVLEINNKLNKLIYLKNIISSSQNLSQNP